MSTETVEIELIENLTIDQDFSGVPHFDQWCGVWMMTHEAFAMQLSIVQSMDISLHLSTVGKETAEYERAASGLRYTKMLDGGVAVMNLQGTLQKHVASMSGGTSTVLARRDLSMLAADPTVRAVVLNIDSPGGTAAGTKEFGDAIKAFEKPIYAHITDLGASAAYWLASQADRITANDFGLVGSIGTYTVVQDLSGLAKKEGVKVHVVKAGAYKGMGAPGTEITDEALAEVQRIVDSRNEMFLNAVADGRKIPVERVKAMADGRVHPSSEAMGLQLIDGISTLEKVVAEARRPFMTSTRKEENRMSDTITAEQKPATVKEIKSACPDCSSDFIVACQEAERTVEQCKDAYIQELATDLAARKEQESVIKEKVTTAKATAGVSELETEVSTEVATANATEEWQEKLEANVLKYGNRAKAVKVTDKQNPGLRQAMLAEING